MFGPKGPFCQSCGMPLSRDILGGGTEADGATSTDYCSHCYRNGTFTEPDITAEAMTTKVRDMLRYKMHLPGFMAKYYSKDIPKLKRWTGSK
jgi:hypothetical protein